jgi:hypothetical protein
MQLRTTSTQRTYRYVRLAIVGAMLLLAVAVAAQVATGGPLDSISAAYYTPARSLFVGALFAVALALLALSGRSVEQVLLDLAAVLAPLVAIVPTPVRTGDVSGVPVTCPGDGYCVPADEVAGVAVGMLSLTVVGILGVATALVLAAAQRALSRGIIVSSVVAAALIAAATTWWTSSPGSFLLAAHNGAAIGFFGLTAVVAVIAAVRPRSGSVRADRALRIAYGVIAAGIVVSLAAVITVEVLRAAGVAIADPAVVPIFFLGEAVALTLFGGFWIVQTVELWNDPDPRLAPARA